MPTVTYSPTSGFPISPIQPCHNFATGETSLDWQMTILGNGAWTLNCNFAKA